MSSFSDYAEGAILDHLFGGTAFTQPTLHVAVSTADPTDDDSGTSEPTGNGYARIATVAGDWSRTTNVTENANELAFPEATGSWGTLTHIAIYDAATGGNLIAHAALTTSKAITTNETLRFPAGNITFTLD